MTDDFVSLWKAEMQRLAECQARAEIVHEVFKAIFGAEAKADLVTNKEFQIEGFKYTIMYRMKDELHDVTTDVYIESTRRDERYGFSFVVGPRHLGNAAFLNKAKEVLKKNGFPLAEFYSIPLDQCDRCYRVSGVEIGIRVGVGNTVVFIREHVPCKCEQ